MVVCTTLLVNSINISYLPDASTQSCDDIVCTQEYDPQCGTNGRTYSNPCMFGIAQCGDVSIQIAYKGECRGK